jgi:glycosyltransferase involved in cell wall biosynthesis
MSRKIIFYAHALAGGGAERVWAQLAQGFSRRGDEVIFVQDFPSHENAAWLDETVRRVTLGRNHLLAVWRLARLIARERPDVSVSALGASNLKLALAAALVGATGRAIISYHGHFAAEPQTLSRIAYLLTPILTRLAARTVCVSDSLRAYLVSVWRASASRTRRIYNPVDVGSDGGADALPLERREPVVISASRLVADKNVDGLVRAFARVEPADARLVLLGDGPERPAIEAEIARLGLGARVSLQGYVDRPWTRYGEARCFALFSNDESFGLVLVEALACGLPVVGVDCGGVREVLDGGRYGRLVAAGDEAGLARALSEILAHPGDAAAGQARARMFSLDAALDAYGALFDEVCASAEVRADVRRVGGATR